MTGDRALDIESPGGTQAVQGILGQVDELVGSGDYRAAIALLEASNTIQPHALLEQRLIDLRIEAYNHLDWPQPPASWSPEYDSRFQSVRGLPEISAQQLDADALLAGILGNGGLIVRGLMGQGLMKVMRENIDCTFEARRAAAAEEPGAANNPWYVRSPAAKGGPVQFGTMGANQYTNTGSVWSIYSPRTAFQLIEYYRDIGLPEILNQYFGEAAVLSVKKWVLRCVPPNNGAASGWHQDGQFLGNATIRTVNLWVALTDCGGDADAPGMEIVAGNERKIYQTGSHGADFEWTVGQGLVDEIGQRHPVQCPRFNAGDAIFFDHYNLHRTAFGLNHTKNRYAVESWFFAGSTAPAKQQPLVF